MISPVLFIYYTKLMILQSVDLSQIKVSEKRLIFFEKFLTKQSVRVNIMEHKLKK